MEFGNTALLSGFAALSESLEYLENYVSIFGMQYIKLKEIIISMI